MKRLASFELVTMCDYFESTKGNVLRKTMVPREWIDSTLCKLGKIYETWGDYGFAAEELPRRCLCVLMAAVIRQGEVTGDSEDWLVRQGTHWLTVNLDLMPDDLICEATYLLAHGRRPSKRYVYSHTPHVKASALIENTAIP